MLSGNTTKKMGKRDYKELYSKIFFFLIIAAIIMIGFLIIRPFISAILSGAVIAYLFHPLYKRFGRIIRNENARAFIISVLLVIIVTVPAIIVFSLLAREALDNYRSIGQHQLGTNLVGVICAQEDNLLCKSLNSLLSFLPASDLNFYLQSIIGKITAGIFSSISGFLASIPNMMLNLMIVLFVVFYLLKDGNAAVKKLSRILPLTATQKSHIFRKFHKVTYGVFIGNLAIAAIQGVIGGIGFMLFGISSPLLWGFVMAIFALIPYFGTAIIWLPAAVNLLLIGVLKADNSFMIRGALLILYGVFIISLLDNFLKPKLIGARAEVHPLLVLLGVLGGINLFGIMGILLGPILLSLLIVLINIYEEEIRLKQ